jgi:hypothetical protein
MQKERTMQDRVWRTSMQRSALMSILLLLAASASAAVREREID